MFAEHSKHQLKIRTQMMLLELRYEPVKRFEASQKTRDQVEIIGLFFTDVSQSPAQAPGHPHVLVLVGLVLIHSQNLPRG